MMQPISYTTRAYKSREGGFNYTAVSMATPYIKWPSTRALSSSSWSHLPLEQLGQDKSPAAFQRGLHSSAQSKTTAQCLLLFPATLSSREGPKEPAFLFPLQLLISCLDDKSFLAVGAARRRAFPCKSLLELNLSRPLW